MRYEVDQFEVFLLSSADIAKGALPNITKLVDSVITLFFMIVFIAVIDIYTVRVVYQPPFIFSFVKNYKSTMYV